MERANPYTYPIYVDVCTGVVVCTFEPDGLAITYKSTYIKTLRVCLYFMFCPFRFSLLNALPISTRRSQT